MSASAAVSRTESGSAGAVRAMAVIGNGAVQTHPEHPYGPCKPLYWRLSNAAPELRGFQRRQAPPPTTRLARYRYWPAGHEDALAASRRPQLRGLHP